MEIKRTYKIPVGNLSTEDAEKLIKKLIDEYKKSDYSYIRELERRELLKNRLGKLNKIYEQDTN